MQQNGNHASTGAGQATSPWQEETFAGLNTQLRLGVEELRLRGEADPVALLCAEGTLRAEIVALIGRHPEDVGEKAALVVLPKAAAAALLNRHVSAGLGDHLLSVPVRPPEAFRLIRVAPGELTIDYLAFEGKAPALVVRFVLDVEARVLRVSTDGEAWDEGRIDW